MAGCNGNKQKQVTDIKQDKTAGSSQVSIASSNIDIWPTLDIAVKTDADNEGK
ncbi:hypothetical protein CPS_3703 [Colwellia psychrerythraea 34H]|uniref:Uncharacterized protein n=1 Tax=Colwellia psychrerythraea (strain 34H / ATCC BAA-681) TaxID=167879 RepID=Q47XV0_COLP3|nr:hypothetical protein CPS_3703 [Colwellia psychrerythraea 34H]